MAIRFFEGLLLVSFLSIAGYGFGRLLGKAFQEMIEQGASVESVRATIARRGGIERGLDSRVRNLRSEMAKIDREIKELVREQTLLRQALNTSRATTDRILRLVGEEVTGRQCFLALVFNRYVASGGGNTLVDPSWAVAQEIEVWAPAVVDAKLELEKRYPPAFGYSITSLIEASQSGDASAPSA